MFWGTVPAPPGVFLPVSLNRNCPVCVPAPPGVFLPELSIGNCPVCPGSLPSRSFTGNQQLYGNHE